MKVAITQEHIDKGKRETPRCCPLALALQEQTGEAYRVGYMSAWVDAANKAPSFERILSTAASKFINSFDRGNKVKPCTITIWDSPS